MFKLVVLSALVAVAVAKPSGIGAIGYSSYLAAPVVQKTVVAAAPVAIPAAVSSSYRTDVVSKPVVATYAVRAPVVQKTVVAAAPVAIPAAVSSSYRTDVVSKPVVATYAAPAVVPAPVVQRTVPVAVPAAVSSSYRTDLVSNPVVATYAAPVVAKTIVQAAPVWQNTIASGYYAPAVPAVRAW